MNWIVGKDSEDWLKHCETWCRAQLNGARNPRIYLPAGQTPLPLYQLWERDRPSYLERCELLQVDDILSPPLKDHFKKFFENQLPSYQDQFHWVSEDRPPAPLAVLGLGLNGHVAFHEPGIPQSFEKGEVTLATSTLEELKAPQGTRGLTYGLGTFQKCERILLVVRGPKKRDILKKLWSHQHQAETRGVFSLKFLQPHCLITRV